MGRSAGDLQDAVVEIVFNATGSRVDIDQALFESGLVDSITAVDIALEVETKYGIAIPATEIGQVLQTTRTLIDYVADHI